MKLLNQSVVRPRTGAWRTAAVAGAAAFSLVLAGCGGESSDDGSIELVLADYNHAAGAEVQALNWIWDEVEKRSNGRVTIEQNHQETLCKAAEIVECVKDGRADIGYAIPSYTPSNFPLAEVMHIPFQTTNAEAVALAYSKLLNEVPAVLEENTALGLKPLVYFTAAPGILGAEKPIDSIDDFKGMKVRAVGDGSLTALKAVGANPVAITANEMYEGLQRGVVDAWVNNVGAGFDFNLFEVTSEWRDVGLGSYTTVGVWISENSWADLPKDVQTIFNEVLDDFLAGGRGYEIYADQFAGKCDSLIESGKVNSFEVWDEAQVNEWRDAIDGATVEGWVTRANDAGAPDAQGVYDQYAAFLKEAEAESDWVSPNAACAEKFSRN